MIELVCEECKSRMYAKNDPDADSDQSILIVKPCVCVTNDLREVKKAVRVLLGVADIHKGARP